MAAGAAISWRAGVPLRGGAGGFFVARAWAIPAFKSNFEWVFRFLGGRRSQMTPGTALLFSLIFV
jgi:hypothetical protein